jgi:YHS domain-containing protein
MFRNFARLIGGLLLALLCTGLIAGEKPVNQNRKGLAIKGYDPVAYFTAQQPTKGDPKFSHAWNGATWNFASTQNLELFKANPTKYAPQFGGYCAWAVSQNDTADIDPTAWKIVKDKLYLNYNESIQKKWEKDIPGLIAKAEKNWPGLIAH